MFGLELIGRGVQTIVTQYAVCSRPLYEFGYAIRHLENLDLLEGSLRSLLGYASSISGTL